jgi:hypothetical protein
MRNKYNSLVEPEGNGLEDLGTDWRTAVKFI